MAGKNTHPCKVFQSAPILLQNGGFKAAMFHFNQERNRIWSDFKITAKKLAKNEELQHDILVFNKEAQNLPGSKYQVQYSQIGVIMAKKSQ